MKIILDARKIEDYGIGVYIQNLFQRIRDAGFHDCRILHLQHTESWPASNGTVIQVSSKNYAVMEHVEIPFKLRRLGDFTYFSPHYVFPLFIKNRLIVTVHDLIHFKFPHLFRPAVKVALGRFFMNQVKKRARVVFTVSETTRDDMVELFGFDKSRVHVVYNGVSDHFFRAPQESSPYRFPYLLYVGNLKPHKNLPTLLRAFSLIEGRFSGVKILILGVEQSEPLLRLIKSLKLEDRVVIKGYQRREELIKYFDGAEFFVFPSYYEGFGFPPLEAMARKKAVISSKGGSLGEILGDGALFFDPDSHEELAEKISLFLEDEGLRNLYQEKGFRRSHSFRWEDTAEKYLAVLAGLE